MNHSKDRSTIMSNENSLNELLESISQNVKYRGCVFHGPGFYFIVVNGKI
jgi:hypothetical protein